MRVTLPLALVLAGCTSEPPLPVTTAALPPLAPVPSTPLASSRSAPALPASITTCERATAHHGSWTPTVDEVVAAASVLPSHCLDPKARAVAIRACAAKLGASTVKVGVGTIEEGVTCDESFLPATWNKRQWIVMDISAFDAATASATGLSFAAELNGRTAVHYASNDGTADCNSAPSGAPAELATLPADLARFICRPGAGP